jgi:putative tryptophan/tyrosine transport system substrate-binding protein
VHDMFKIPSARSRSDNLKSKIESLKWLGIIAIGFTFAMCGAVAQAQQPKKMFRIGILFYGSRDQPNLQSFQQELRELGYVDRKNIALEYRYAEGKPDRLAPLAADLVRLPVDVIVTTTDQGARAASEATWTIPIVLTTGDPVGSGLAANLAKPGGNVTGLTVLLADLSGKRLELLKETIPSLNHVAVLWSADSAGISAFKETQAAALGFSLQLNAFEVDSVIKIDRAFSEMPKARTQALHVVLSPLMTLNSKRIVDLAAKNRLPAMYATRQFVEEGGLMAYGPSIGDLYRRAATYVDKILKGAKPADLPVEQPKKFEFFINLKAAQQIGLTIPPNVLARADRVIK